MPGLRLDQYLHKNSIVTSRSQAENYIKLGYVTVDGKPVSKPSRLVSEKSEVLLIVKNTFVSRAALKLESVSGDFKLNFKFKVVLDVGSSTGGFTQFALSRGASKVIAVEVGTNQMDSKLRLSRLIELHEQTDIRQLKTLSTKVDIVVIDVSFISLRQILPHILTLIGPEATIVAMVKPQFEINSNSRKNKGVIKNESIRRSIFRDFELWAKPKFKIVDKADSQVSGEKGNRERFYLLKPLNTA